MNLIPRKPSGKGPAATFMRAVWEALWGNEARPGQATNPITRGQIVYIKCCLGDGSECFVPVVIRGTIYRSNGGTTEPPTITEADVPDGYTTLE